MGNARKDAEHGHLSGVYAGLLRRIVPRKVGIVTGCALALILVLATLVAAWRGDGEGANWVFGPLLFPGVDALWARLILSLVDGLAVGYVVGDVLARLRNAIVALYLRIVWSRYQHHVANDLLDKL